MDDIQGKVFKDFEPTSYTDGSYLGMVKHSEESKKHYEMKFKEELVKVNQRLRSSKIKVSIESTKGALQLRATLPLKPDDTHPQGKLTKQYKISLGIPANFEGLKTAEEEAYELGRLIARKMFVWNDKYLGAKAVQKNNITFDKFCEQLEERFFEKRKRTLKSENTFDGFKYPFKKYFSGSEIITIDAIRKRVLTTTQPYVRKRAIVAACFICKQLDIDCSFNDLKLPLIPSKRNIPSDEEIKISFNLFDEYFTALPLKREQSVQKNKLHKIIYILMSAYGLRPREILNQPDIDWFVSKNNAQKTFKVHESNKTGYREVFPFMPELLDLVDVNSDSDLINSLRNAIKWQDVKLLTARVTEISKYFSKVGIPFKPYDLRHACAIRAHLQRVPIKAAADNLGHSVEMHTKVYQRWFGLENRRKAFEQTFEDINEIDRLRDELARAKQEIADLKLKLARTELQKMV
ncbi:MAG: site-specific integrase [Rivularia sp. (in: cyanobacteria)]